MRGFLFIIAIILIIVYGVGLFFYALKGLFHIVIIIAALAFIMALLNRGKSRA